MEPLEPAAAVDPPDPAGPTPEAPALPTGRVWALALLASTLAGLGAWLAGEATLRQFVPPERIVVAMGIKMNVPTFENNASADRKNASLASGILGACLGLALGLAGGIARKSPRSAIVAGLVGALIGLGAGVGGSEAILPIYFRQLDAAAEDLSRDILLPMLIHSGSWAAIGAAGGIALAMGLGARRKIVPAALGGLVGAILGAAAYEVIGALAFPHGRTTEPLAALPTPRLIGKLTVAILSASLATFAIVSSPRKPAGTPRAG